MDYTGQRSKDSMVNWLLKKTRDPVVQIDKEGYEKLAAAGSVAFVFHGDLSTNAEAHVLNQIAMADDYNTYYWGTELNPDCAGVEVIRSFDAAACYPALDDGLKKWVEKNQRPLIVEFDERTIGDIFSSRKLGCTLFNGASSNEMIEAFNAAAQEYANSDGQPLVFTSINADNEHFENLANYIKIKHQKSPLVVLDAGNKKKYVYMGEMTKEGILEFLNNYSANEYDLTGEIKYEDDATPTEEEL